MSILIRANEARNRDNHGKTKRVLSDLAKLAVDFTFNDSLKGITGPRKLYKIVQERFRSPPASLSFSSCKKPEDKMLAEKLRMRVEEMLEDMAKLKQQDESSSSFVDQKENPSKGQKQGSKKLVCSEPEKKPIFIRSRL